VFWKNIKLGLKNFNLLHLSTKRYQEIRGEHGQDQDWISYRILAIFSDQDWIWIFVFEKN